MRQHKIGKTTERHRVPCDGFQNLPTDHAGRLRQASMRFGRLHVQWLIVATPRLTLFSDGKRVRDFGRPNPIAIELEDLLLAEPLPRLRLI